MPLFSAFCAGSNEERSSTLDAALTMNLYRSTNEAAGGAAKAATLYGTPGTRVLGEVATSNGRGVFTEDGRTWTVVGPLLYELTFNAVTGAVTAATSLGIVPDDGLPVSWASNGDAHHQLAIVGGGELHILNTITNVLSAAISLPMTNAPLMVGYIDSYFILMERDSVRIWFSGTSDGTIWDALDVFARSTANDHVRAMVCANSRIWVFGSETSEAYEDVGDADNPFQPIRGSLFQIGIAAPWSLSVGFNTLRWLGQSSRGGNVVYRLDGYSGTRISTHALEAQLGTASTLADAEGMTYEQDGHLFYCLSCPSMGVAGETHVFDETEQDWHQRSYRNATVGRDEVWRVRGHAWVGQTHVVGSRDSGAIWALDLATYADAGSMIRAVRRAPYLGKENTWMFLDRVELGVEAGVGLINGQGSDPQIELRVSKDNGKTWFSAGTAGIGQTGQWDTCAFWTRLGKVRVDRLVLEVVITDPVRRALGPGLWLDVTPARASRAA